MSIVLSIFGNHKIELDSYDSGIEKIQSIFETQIKDFGKDISIPEETSNIGDLVFWTNHTFHKIKFEENNWGIWLNCNHTTCDRIRIFKHSIDFSIPKINTRYNIWKDLISNQYLTKERYSEYIDKWKIQAKNWKEFKFFIKETISKIGGDTIIYLNDSNFQDIEGSLCTGGNFEQALEILTNKSKGIKIEELINDKENKFEKMENWFIERIEY